jgi:hypothetical protein
LEHLNIEHPSTLQNKKARNRNSSLQIDFLVLKGI